MAGNVDFGIEVAGFADVNKLLLFELEADADDDKLAKGLDAGFSVWADWANWGASKGVCLRLVCAVVSVVAGSSCEAWVELESVAG